MERIKLYLPQARIKRSMCCVSSCPAHRRTCEFILVLSPWHPTLFILKASTETESVQIPGIAHFRYFSREAEKLILSENSQFKKSFQKKSFKTLYNHHPLPKYKYRLKRFLP